MSQQQKITKVGLTTMQTFDGSAGSYLGQQVVMNNTGTIAVALKTSPTNPSYSKCIDVFLKNNDKWNGPYEIDFLDHDGDSTDMSSQISSIDFATMTDDSTIHALAIGASTYLSRTDDGCKSGILSVYQINIANTHISASLMDNHIYGISVTPSGTPVTGEPISHNVYALKNVQLATSYNRLGDNARNELASNAAFTEYENYIDSNHNHGIDTSIPLDIGVTIGVESFNVTTANTEVVDIAYIYKNLGGIVKLNRPDVIANLVVIAAGFASTSRSTYNTFTGNSTSFSSNSFNVSYDFLYTYTFDGSAFVASANLCNIPASPSVSTYVKLLTGSQDVISIIDEENYAFIYKFDYTISTTAYTANVLNVVADVEWYDKEDAIFNYELINMNDTDAVKMIDVNNILCYVNNGTDTYTDTYNLYKLTNEIDAGGEQTAVTIAEDIPNATTLAYGVVTDLTELYLVNKIYTNGQISFPIGKEIELIPHGDNNEDNITNSVSSLYVDEKDNYYGNSLDLVTYPATRDSFNIVVGSKRAGLNNRGKIIFYNGILHRQNEITLIAHNTQDISQAQINTGSDTSIVTIVL